MEKATTPNRKSDLPFDRGAGEARQLLRVWLRRNGYQSITEYGSPLPPLKGAFDWLTFATRRDGKRVMFCDFYIAQPGKIEMASAAEMYGLSYCWFPGILSPRHGGLVEIEITDPARGWRLFKNAPDAHRTLVYAPLPYVNHRPLFLGMTVPAARKLQRERRTAHHREMRARLARRGGAR